MDREMMKNNEIRVAICVEDAQKLERIKQEINESPISCKVWAYESMEALLSAYAQGQRFDLVLLDMPKSSGEAFVREILDKVAEEKVCDGRSADGKSTELIQVKVDSKFVPINNKDIIYIEAANKNIIIVTKENTYILRGTLREIGGKLPKQQFFRVQNSFIINLAHVADPKKRRIKEVEMINKKQIPVGRKKWKELMEAIVAYINDEFH